MDLSLRRTAPVLAAGVLCLLVAAAAPVPAGGILRSQPRSHDEASLELVREELRAGRYWHAAELLEAMSADEGLEPEGLLLLAEARAGYQNWEGVEAILEDADWLDSLAPVRGRELLARAHEMGGRWDVALHHYRRASEAAEEVTFSLLARLIRAELRVGEMDSALRSLDRAPGSFGELLPFLSWELAEAEAEVGDSVVVAALLARVQHEFLRERSRDLMARAVLSAGDSTRAEELYRELVANSPGRTAPAYRHQVAELTLARGDTAAARELFRVTLEEAPWRDPGMWSAARLVDLGGLDRETSRVAARALDRMGDGARALEAYDRYVLLSGQAGVEPDVGSRVERARLAATVPTRIEEAVEEFRALDEHPDPAVGARVLDVWTALRRRQGQANNVRTLRRWLVERYPDTDQAAQVVFLRGDDAQDRRDWGAAVDHFREVTRMAPTRNLAGLAWMRIGQIRLHTGDTEGALEAYRAYLGRFPDGRRWAEASFWAGRILVERGDTASAEPLLDRVLRDDALSYYAAESAGLLGRPFPLQLEPLSVPEDAPWVTESLAVLDALEAAGLRRSAAVHVDRLVERADREGPAAQYPAAEGLIRRGWTIEGINRGWALLRGGAGYNPRLLAILFPFPEREMVEREAEEYGLDPLLMAALIRQESAWDRDIVSHAGAIGLMQVMPPTGRELARAVGPRGFTPESLEAAEVNLHLGGQFLRDMLDRYGPDLPLVLSAYNAGPTRARRWRGFPEVVDRLRFTERIPFTETRGYVKNVTRNVAIYRSLYGPDSARAVTN